MVEQAKSTLIPPSGATPQRDSLPIHVANTLGREVDLAPAITHEVKTEPVVGRFLTVAERAHELVTIIRSPQRAWFLAVRSWLILLSHLDSHTPRFGTLSQRSGA